MPVEPVGSVEGEKSGNAEDDRPEDFIPNVEIIVGEATALVRQDAVVGILGGIFGDGNAEGAALFPTRENEINAEGVGLFQSTQGRQDVIFFADSLFGPLDGNAAIAGEGFHPGLVVVGALTEHFLVDRRAADDIAEEVDDLLGAGEAIQVAVDNDAVEAVLYKDEKAVEQLGEQLHRSGPRSFWGPSQIIGPGDRWGQLALFLRWP